MSEWKKYKLAEVLTFYNGKEVSVKDEDIFPVYGSNGIIGFNNESCFENAVIIGRVGAYCGSVFYEKNKFWASDNTIVVKEKEEFDIVFIFYLLSFLDLNRFAGGSAQPLLTHSYIKPISLNFPPLRIQQKIAAILSAYDDLIENNLKQIKLLEEMAQITYEEWFVRFKFPNHENTPVDEVTGLPLEWERKKLGVCCDVTSSKRIFLSDYTEKGIPFYRGKEIILKSKNESVNDWLYIATDKYLEIEKSFGIPKTGDILITAVGTLGFPYLVNDSDGQFYFKDGNLIWLRNFGNSVSSHYFINLFKSNHFQNLLHSIAIGSGQKALTIQGIKNLDVFVPTKKVIDSFDKLIVPISNLIEKLLVENQLLKEARDILLPRLMTGKIAV